MKYDQPKTKQEQEQNSRRVSWNNYRKNQRKKDQGNSVNFAKFFLTEKKNQWIKMSCKIVIPARKIRQQLLKVIIYQQESMTFLKSGQMVFEFCLAEFKACRKRLNTLCVYVDSESSKYIKNWHSFACCYIHAFWNILSHLETLLISQPAVSIRKIDMYTFWDEHTYI